MLELLEHYPLQDILIFSVILAVAARGVYSFLEWIQQVFSKAFNKERVKLKDKQKLEHRLAHGSQIMSQLQKNQREMDAFLQDIQSKLNMLIESDKDDIKAYITRQHHHFCYHKGWIDDFSLDCIEKRYKHYKIEGGNTFIDGFMEQLRALPKENPLKNKKR